MKHLTSQTLWGRGADRISRGFNGSVLSSLSKVFVVVGNVPFHKVQGFNGSNEPVMANQAKLFPSNMYSNRVLYLLTPLLHTIVHIC